MTKRTNVGGSWFDQDHGIEVAVVGAWRELWVWGSRYQSQGWESIDLERPILGQLRSPDESGKYVVDISWNREIWLATWRTSWNG